MKSMDDWVREFGINAIAEVEAIMVGNPKLANKYARNCNDAFVAFGAGQALKRWDEGTCQLDPE